MHWPPQIRAQAFRLRKVRWVVRLLVLVFCVEAALSGTLGAQVVSNPIVRFQTDFGHIDVVLLRDTAPKTVQNFLNYVQRGAYDGTFLHRSVASFVIQGGGYRYRNDAVETVPADPPVVNEFKVSNTRGTLAMAKLGGDPNSATNQWFFNLSDSNASNLDAQNGGFTVFGRIVSSPGLAVMDTIAALQRVNAGSPFDSLPVQNFSGGTIQDANLVHLISVKMLAQLSIQAITGAGTGSLHLQCTGVPSVVNRIESSSDLGLSGFSPLASVVADAAGSFQYNDPSPGPRKFYRVVYP